MTVHHHQVEHGSIAYQWSHEPCARPLVVLHGLGDSSIHTYAPKFANTVLKHTPSLFIDFAGFGEGTADALHSGTIDSMAEDIAHLLGTLKIRDISVFAHSMGANVSLVLAHQHPILVSDLILAEPLLQREQSVLAAGIAKFGEDNFLSRGYGMLVRATSIQAHRGELASVAFLPTLKMANPLVLHRAAISLLEQRETGFLELLRHRKHHTTILVGGTSGVFTDALKQAGIHIIEIPNAGHFMFVQQSDATACAILNLVNGMHYGGIEN